MKRYIRTEMIINTIGIKQQFVGNIVEVSEIK